MTFTEARNRVINYTKSGLPSASGTNKLDDFVNDTISRIYMMMVTSRMISEFLQPRASASLTSTATDGLVVLPGTAPVLTVSPGDAIQEVRFKTSTGIEYNLWSEEGRVPPAPVAGKPRSYRLVVNAAGPKSQLYIEPFATVASGSEFCYVWYYQVPAPFAVSGTGTVQTTAWSNLDYELVDRACAEVFNYFGQYQKAQMLLAKYEKQTPNPPSGNGQ